jgi:hypothetical protein
MTRRVWIAQCLCGPQRHCLLAAAGEADSEDQARREVEAPLRANISEALRSAVLNPWCGLCGARSDIWFYDVGCTRWATLAEALPAMRESERQQAMMRAAWRNPDEPLN